LVSNLKYETQYRVVSATAVKCRRAELVFVEEFRLKREVNPPVVLVIICYVVVKIVLGNTEIGKT